jgi:hypothetical protein
MEQFTGDCNQPLTDSMTPAPDFAMTNQVERTKRRRWWPRFSARTLTILVTLICAYFGAWEATKRHAARAGSLVLSPDFRVLRHMDRKKDSMVGVINEMFANQHNQFTLVFYAKSPAPFVVARSCSEVTYPSKRRSPQRIRYDVWLFGLSLRTPFESTEH